MSENAYVVPGFITGILTFFACWAYAIASYGWFLGIGLGWLPSLFIAFLAGLLWPLLLLAALFFAWVFFA